jgi:hypothetical protein
LTEIAAKRTPWKDRELLADYARAWRIVIGGELGRPGLALLRAMACIETGHGGASCYNGNIGNVMPGKLWRGEYHVLKLAPECYDDPDDVPDGGTILTKTNIACEPGQVAAIPPGGSRFRAYASILDGCIDKLRRFDAQWPRAIIALVAATSPASAVEFVAGLLTPKRYFSASPASYANGMRDISARFLRTAPDDVWPALPLSQAPDTIPSTPTSKSSQSLRAVNAPILDGAATPIRAGEGEHTPLHLRDEKPGEPTE